MKTIGAQIDTLIKTRNTFNNQAWYGKLHNLRSNVFGEDFECALFPVKLHKITSEASLNQEIFWLKDGKSFAIDRELYQRRIMGILFNQTTIRSLQNQLRKYGFKTELVVGYEEFPPEIAFKYSVYSHPLFIQGRLDLSCRIKIEQQSNAEPAADKIERVPRNNFGMQPDWNGRKDSFGDLIKEVDGQKERAILRSISTVSMDSFQHFIDASGIQDTQIDSTDCSIVGMSVSPCHTF